MLFKTHLAFAFFIALVCIPAFSPQNQVLFVSLALFGGILPDIDHPRSKIGRYFPFVSMLFEHRGFFHSFFAIPILVIILYLFNLSSFVLPISVGYVSHLISDIITKEGIMPGHPFSRDRIHGFITTGGRTEFVFFILTVISSGYLLLHM